MTDPISAASFALSLVKSTTEALSALRERSKTTKDLDIKEQISTLYDNVLQLKEAISRLLDENRELKKQLEAQQHPTEKPEIRQVGQTNYYYQGDKGPFCQPCYDRNQKLVALLPAKQSNLGGVHRDCQVCHGIFYETPNSSARITPRAGGRWS